MTGIERALYRNDRLPQETTCIRDRDDCSLGCAIVVKNERESGKAGSGPPPCSRPSYLRACLHGGGGPQVGDVTCLGGVTCLSIESLILI